jgi:hypothetical protein
MRIDVAVLVENMRRIFGRAWEGNLGSRRIFLTVLVGHKKTLSGPHVARGPLFAHPWTLDNVGSLTSHNHIGLHGLLRGQLYFF